MAIPKKLIAPLICVKCWLHEPIGAIATVDQYAVVIYNGESLCGRHMVEQREE